MNSDIFRTEQIHGSDFVVKLKKLFRKKLFVRAGYLPSRSAFYLNKPQSKIDKIKVLEKYVMKNADVISLTTEFLKDYVISEYGINEEKIHIISNYIDTDIFKPNPSIKVEKGRICTIVKRGKVNSQKNFQSLVLASKEIPGSKLIVIGGAGENSKLVEGTKKINDRVKFLGIIPNEKVPDEINKSEIFVLPSFYEGNPKSLLEAMACQKPIIGTNVEGIKNIIKDRENGLLCETDPSSISKSIRYLLSEPDVQKRISENARNYVLNNCTLDKVSKKELEIYRKLLV